MFEELNRNFSFIEMPWLLFNTCGHIFHQNTPVSCLEVDVAGYTYKYIVLQ